MPNRRYEAGRRFEYQIIHEYEKEGFLAFRSAGSHSFADVVVVSPEGIVGFIQAKTVASDKRAQAVVKNFVHPMPNLKASFGLFVKVTGGKVYRRFL